MRRAGTSPHRVARSLITIARRAASLPLYPVLMLTGFVLFQYVDVVVDGTQAARPIVAGAALALVAQLCIGFVLGDGHRAAAAVAALLLFIALGVSALTMAIVAGFVIRSVFHIWRHRRHGAPRSRLDWPRITGALNTLTTMFVLVVMANGVAAEAIGWPRIDVRFAIASVPANAPDIYVILLDSYPRADELATKFGVDNGPFLDGLRDRGFEVAARSRSNYADTALTLVSMLSMREARRIPGLAEMLREPEKHQRLVQRQLGESLPALEKLRGYGYETISISPSIGQVGVRSVDRHFDAIVDEFTLHLARVTWIGQLVNENAPELWFHSFRQRPRESLDVLRDLASARPQRPRFVLTHLLPPHAPFVFSAAGEARSVPACFPECSPFDPPGPLTEDMPAYWDQLQYTNRLVLDVVDDIVLASRTPPVIIVMSDHGTRFFGAPENTHNLWAAFTPGKQGVFPDDGTPVNLFPRLLNAYFDARLPLVREHPDIRRL